MFLTGGASGSESRGVKDKYLSTALSAAEMIRKGCTACYDLSAEFPLPSAEGISAMGRAYRDAGMRAVVAPMITDKTIYEALPGLLEALPDDIRSRYASLRSAPGKATIDACARILAKWERLLRRDAQEAASRLDAANDVALAGAKSVAKFVGMFCAAQGCAGYPVRRNLDVVCES